MPTLECRSCRSQDIAPVLSFGDQPLANRLLDAEGLTQDEPTFPLSVAVCRSCWLLQLEETVAPELLFDDYAYASSTVIGFQSHFDELASALKSRLNLAPGSLVVEPGSNDGILQRPLKNLGIRDVGVEPAQNLCQRAWAEGFETINSFFGAQAVSTLGEESADAVVACNVFAHNPDIHSFTDTVVQLLRPGGSFVIEVSHVGDMLRDLTWDSIYFEHVFYWSLTSMARLLTVHGLTVAGVDAIPTHGGSFRIWATKQSHGESPEVVKWLEREAQAGLQDYSTYTRFASEVGAFQDRFSRRILELAAQGRRIVGYGSPAKATTLLNSCGLAGNEIQYIIDDSPLKQGRFLPGLHIPIVGPERLEREPPDVLLVLAWNYADQIREKTQHLGVEYLVPTEV